MSALDLSLRGQAAAIAAGEADPAELLDAALARIEQRNPAINAVVETFPERSREMLGGRSRGPAARGAGRDQGRVAAALAGAALRRRAKCSPPPRPGESGPYRALRDAGATIVGVGNMHELGAGSTGNVSVYGPARNPWNTERCPGGSSSGPAAAVAARLVAGAVGADGIGSVRFPAAYCGLTGLKPTFGRSAMAGHHMAAMTTHDRLRAALRRRRRLPAAGLGPVRREPRGGRAAGLRIGVVRDTVSEDVAPEVREACEDGDRGACAPRPAARSARSRCPTSSRRRWPPILIVNAEGLGGLDARSGSTNSTPS